MTTVLRPPSGEPQLDERRPGTSAGVFERFDLLDRIGIAIANYAEVEPAVRPPSAPRLDAALLRRAGAAISHNRKKRTAFLAFAGLVLAFSAAVIGLLATGVLSAAYEAIWSRFPGRPWTHVMRDHPWIYGALAAALSVVPFLLAPRDRWGRAFLAYMLFVVGFLGGHVFW
jgi:hypothetical protein